MSDDKEPVDNHDFSDFDDLFAEQDDDFDPSAVLNAEGDDPPSKSESSTETVAQPQSDANPIENDDIDALIDDLMDDDILSESDAVEPPLSKATNDDDPSDSAVDALLDEEWDDVVSPDKDGADEKMPDEEASLEVAAEKEEAPIEDEAVEAIADVAPVSDDATLEDNNNDIIMDDEIPDIDFIDDSEDAAKDAVDDDVVEELESFDDFIIDDDEPTIATEFSEQAALDPTPQPVDAQPVDAQPVDEVVERSVAEPASAESTSAPPTPAEPTSIEPDAPDSSDEWVDDEIIPDQPSESEQKIDLNNEEEEDESVKQSNMIALIAGAVALLASMGALWLGYSAKAELAQMPVQAVGSGSALDAAKLKALDDKMGQVDDRITKLSTKLASFGAMTGGSDPKVDALDGRTARLEQLVSDVKEEIGHLRHAIATQPSKPPSVRKVFKSSPKKRLKSKPKAKPAQAVRRSGKWFVNLTSHANPRSAQHQIQQMKKLNITAESRQVVVKGRTYYRVRIAGFASRSKSIAFKAMLAKKYHISDSWVSNH